jgi:hypothetical protein
MQTKFTKSTDAEHEVKLESSLIAAAWRCGAAFGGQKASFEVITSFVGEGASIKLTGKTENGKSLGKISDVIRNNKFIGAFDVPSDIERGDLAYFEVQLPANGLSGESNRIPVGPPIDVTNLKWSAKEARRGDKLKLTADARGVPDGTEAKITIFEYDRDNIHDRIVELMAEVKNQKIEIEWEYEYYEDTDEIPTEEELNRYGKNYNPPEYFFTVTIGDAVFGKKQESGLLEFKDWIEIELKDENGNPVPNQRYVIELPDGSKKEGNLDENGHAKIEGIPPGAINVSYPDALENEESEESAGGQDEGGSTESSDENEGEEGEDDAVESNQGTQN